VRRARIPQRLIGRRPRLLGLISRVIRELQGVSIRIRSGKVMLNSLSVAEPLRHVTAMSHEAAVRPVATATSRGNRPLANAVPTQ
jgi:hypothetical protein